jgi:hypothetical protein
LPPKAGDINVMENIWGVMCDDVYKDGKSYECRESLVQAIQAAWKRVQENRDMMHKMFDGMEARVKAVIDHKGRWTK